MVESQYVGDLIELEPRSARKLRRFPRVLTKEWTGWDLNPRPLPCQDSDLPADLPAQRPARKLAGIKRYPGGPQAVRARTRVSLESAFFGGMPNRSSFSTPRNFSPGISTGYTLVRQPKQMSSFGWLRARTSPVMLRYPRESA